jgi:hypothetical protein
MKTLFTAEAISKGGRSGAIQTPAGLLNVTLRNPLEKRAEKRGPNPELLFAFDDYGKKSAAWRTETTTSRPKERTTNASRR